MDGMIRIEILIRQLIHGEWSTEKLDEFKEHLHKAGIHEQLSILDGLYDLHMKAHWIMLPSKYMGGPMQLKEQSELEAAISDAINVIKSRLD